jgi:hypothetical protein
MDLGAESVTIFCEDGGDVEWLLGRRGIEPSHKSILSTSIEEDGPEAPS